MQQPRLTAIRDRGEEIGRAFRISYRCRVCEANVLDPYLFWAYLRDLCEISPKSSTSNVRTRLKRTVSIFKI
jgi:hypothetical protein